MGYETICHRLSTPQRPEAPGVPFFFIRVDRAGNISKRQSATHFHFSKSGGTRSLWNIYEAFAQPGRIVPQLAEMPDGRVYLWVARTITHEPHAWGLPGKTFDWPGLRRSMPRAWSIRRAWTRTRRTRRPRP